MEARDTQSRHQTLSRWKQVELMVLFMKRTGNITACNTYPSFSLARAVLLDVTLGEHMVPKDKREVLG